MSLGLVAMSGALLLLRMLPLGLSLQEPFGDRLQLELPDSGRELTPRSNRRLLDPQSASYCTLSFEMGKDFFRSHASFYRDGYLCRN